MLDTVPERLALRAVDVASLTRDLARLVEPLAATRALVRIAQVAIPPRGLRPLALRPSAIGLRLESLALVVAYVWTCGEVDIALLGAVAVLLLLRGAADGRGAAEVRPVDEGRAFAQVQRDKVMALVEALRLGQPAYM